MKINKKNKELKFGKENKKKENTSLLLLNTLEPMKINNSKFLSIDIQLKENDIKNIKLNSADEIDDKMNLFCKENNIPSHGKKYIKNILLQEINKKISNCKFHFI